MKIYLVFTLVFCQGLAYCKIGEYNEIESHRCIQLWSVGTSPGLYDEREMQSIVSQMMPGGVQTKKIDKIEQAFERFLKRIRQNLHVVVCLSYRGQ